MTLRGLTIGVCVLLSFVLILFFEFNSWFYNNEMPAYLRAGVLPGEASGAVRTFYEASRDACSRYHPNDVALCQQYQLALLAEAPYVRPVSSAAGLLLALLVDHGLSFMPALKFSIIALALGGAVLCGLALWPLLTMLPNTALMAIGLVWVGGWIGTRPLHLDSSLPKAALVIFALLVIASAVLRTNNLFQVVSGFRLDTEKLQLPSAPGLLFRLAAIVLCYLLGYHLHVLFESPYPIAYLLLAITLWPLLNHVFGAPFDWALSGLLCASLYLMSALVPTTFALSLAKQHMQLLVGVMIFISIWRADARVFWALPLILIFDVQNAMRLCALVIIAEAIVGFGRRRMPVAAIPAATTALIAGVVMTSTVVYPFDARLYNVSDALAVFRTPAVLTSGFVALVMIYIAVDKLSRSSSPSLALDRLFVYAASAVVMAGLHISTRGFLFDAFQLSTVFISIAIAPTIAVVSTAVGLSIRSGRDRGNESKPLWPIVLILGLLLLLSATRGKSISLRQLSDGIRSTTSGYISDNWFRRTPAMTLQDNIVYIDGENLMSSALMQYSLIKVLLLSRKPDFASQEITVRVFGGPDCDPVACRRLPKN